MRSNSQLLPTVIQNLPSYILLKVSYWRIDSPKQYFFRYQDFPNLSCCTLELPVVLLNTIYIVKIQQIAHCVIVGRWRTHSTFPYPAIGLRILETELFDEVSTSCRYNEGSLHLTYSCSCACIYVNEIQFKLN